jgi:hypothetical protein
LRGATESLEWVRVLGLLGLRSLLALTTGDSDATIGGTTVGAIDAQGEEEAEALELEVLSVVVAAGDPAVLSRRLSHDEDEAGAEEDKLGGGACPLSCSVSGGAGVTQGGATIGGPGSLKAAMADDEPPVVRVRGGFMMMMVGGACVATDRSIYK